MNKIDKIKNVHEAINGIEKQFGKGAVMRLGDSVQKKYDVISSGSIGLNIALGVGGVPRGRVIEIFGPESSGKTTLALHIIAEAQKLGDNVAIVDSEHALEPSYAKNLGVNTKELYLSQPSCGEEALEIVEILVRSGAFGVVVIDSVAALVPRAEIEGDMGDSHVGLHARLMSQALRKLTSAIHNSNTLVVFINQTRMKIGVMFGNKNTTTGGMALKFYTTIRMDIVRIGSVKSGENIIGNRTVVRVVKNKIAPPFKKAEFDIIYGKGVSKTGEILDYGILNNIIKKSGAWYFYKEERISQGRENAIKFLDEREKIRKEIEEKIKEIYNG